MPSSTAMRSFTLLFLLYVTSTYAAVLSPRATSAPVCVGLSVKSNNGDRKVALVIDSSGSMAETDPLNLRLAAGRALNDWLITKAEATGGKKPDLVTVINFDYTATLDYPLGDPAGANSSFDNIGAFGGTFIAGGVDKGIAQLTSSSSGSTSGRSSIIVFTDGEVGVTFQWQLFNHYHDTFVFPCRRGPSYPEKLKHCHVAMLTMTEGL